MHRASARWFATSRVHSVGIGERLESRTGRLEGRLVSGRASRVARTYLLLGVAEEIANGLHPETSKGGLEEI